MIRTNWLGPRCYQYIGHVLKRSKIFYVPSLKVTYLVGDNKFLFRRSIRALQIICKIGINFENLSRKRNQSSLLANMYSCKWIYIWNIMYLVYTTQVNSSFRADWLARRWLAKYYSPPSSQRKTKWLPVSNKITLKQVKILFGPLVIQLVWYILKQ